MSMPEGVTHDPHAYPLTYGDPIVCGTDGKWYFYEETWADTQGPYDTLAECRAALRSYGDWLNGVITVSATVHVYPAGCYCTKTFFPCYICWESEQKDSIDT